MSILAIIPARGGSKGIPGKNLRLLDNKPLIAYTIDQAKESKYVERIIVSTDDPVIKSVSINAGSEVILRPHEISGDTASSESSLVHVLNHLQQHENYQPELVVFLQCTSPLRAKNDIDKAIEQIRLENSDSLVSVSPTHKFIWENKQGICQSINYDYRCRPRRQDMNPQFEENGSIYIFKPWILGKFNNRLGGKISMFVMKQYCIDIDDILDFEILNFIFSKNKKNSKMI